MASSRRSQKWALCIRATVMTAAATFISKGFPPKIATFAICFFPILLVYYPLLAFGLDRAKSGELPPYMVWLGNIVLGLIGIFLYRRMVRY